MSLATKLRRAPLRIVSGAFILNSGLTKLRKGDDATAAGVHGMASGAYPPFGKMQPRTFLTVLGTGETALGGALLSPVVPAGLAGAGLTGFAGALLGLYWRTEGTHEPGDPRPTQQGTALAKDIWLLGIGLGLVLDAMTTRKDRKRTEQ